MSQGVEKAKDAPGVRQGKKGPGGKLTTGSSYTTPGVYVRDIPSGVRLVREAETSIAAFLGCVAQASPPEGPVRVGNWGEFSRRFPPQAGNGSSAFLPEAVYGYFANGGGPCYVIHVPRDAAGAAYTAALLLLETVPEVTMVAAPDLRNTTAGATVAADPKQVYQEMAKHCTKMRNRMALVDPASDLPPDDPAKVQEWLGSLGLDDVDKQFAAVYYPWVTVPGLHGKPLAVPPSGHVAGVWGRSDARRGVHKAPANETLAYANALTVTLTAGEQGPLNEVGVNCLRSFPGRGLKVWGARTLSPETDWRYVNVRRLVNFLCDSIKSSTDWAVFEPNDATLWSSIRRTVTAFLTDQWRQGALKGRTTDEAFYVICDETNNPDENIAQGEVVCDIGIAPVRPAEFVVFQITQIITPTTTTA